MAGWEALNVKAQLLAAPEALNVKAQHEMPRFGHEMLG